VRMSNNVITLVSDILKEIYLKLELARIKTY
jgi:hypothetical protein